MCTPIWEPQEWPSKMILSLPKCLRKCSATSMPSFVNCSIVIVSATEVPERAKVEDQVGRQLSPYAVTKYADELYAHAFGQAYGLELLGLRYFNVFGPREDHKGRMMSVLHQLLRQLKEEGICRLFEGTEGYANGEQHRDFIFVGDVVAINLHFGGAGMAKGIVNAGTGKARSFNDIARTLITHLGRGRIEYIPFPDALRGKYQSFTQADVRSLREAGYSAPFTELEAGIEATLVEI